MTNYLVEAKLRSDLQELANLLRQELGPENCLYFPIVEILDVITEVFSPEFSYEIVSDNELPENTHADTDVLTGHIRIKESVYNGACEGKGRDRMTIAHELGHFLTLCLCGFKLERNFRKEEFPSYRDPEWQAKCFAGELLVPAHLVKDLSPKQIAKQCGVSVDAAKVQYRHIHEGGDENCL